MLPNPKDFLCKAVNASLRAGDAILEVYDSGFEVDYKADRSPVTEADRRSHAVLLDCLRGVEGRCGPADIPVLSEEGSSVPYRERSSWPIYWLIDPLDGTKEFIKRRGEFTVNVALIQENRPILGVVYLPAKSALYFAASGLGAYFTGSTPLKSLKEMCAAGAPEDPLAGPVRGAVRLPTVPAEEQTRALRLVHSSSHHSPEEEAFLVRLRAELGEITAVPAGSSLKFCLVAQGDADVYPRFGPTMEWDTGAGQCIVEQAGGEVRLIGGGRLMYNKEDLRNGPFIATGTGACSGRWNPDLVMSIARGRV
jgi:3'(2'), 5'-bisphosphate nucleotidase